MRYLFVQKFEQGVDEIQKMTILVLEQVQAVLLILVSNLGTKNMKRITDKTRVINDPLDQPWVPAGSDFPLDFEKRGREDGQPVWK